MYTQQRFEFLPALRWTREIFVFGFVWAGLIAALYSWGWTWLRLPALPVTVLGTAVAFYLGFKGNAAYDRMWEARKIWGGIVNSSRTWGIHVTGMVTDHQVEDATGLAPLDDVHRELVYRHVAWLNALRTQLRRIKSWEHDHELNRASRRRWGTYDMGPETLSARISGLVPDDERAWLLERKNQATQLLNKQSLRLRELHVHAEGRIDSFRYMELAGLLEEFFTLQGKCERIKNFPLPRQYATVNHWFVKAFILAVPLAVVGAFDDLGSSSWVWLAVPTSMILSWVFFIWDRVVDFTENPFEGLINESRWTRCRGPSRSTCARCSARPTCQRRQAAWTPTS
jgi:putative membrane protein